MIADITVQTTIAGIVNGEAFNGRVEASLNAEGGGRSSCEFSKLPRGFNPAVFGTQT